MCEHSWRYGGRVHDARKELREAVPLGFPCEDPRRIACRDCPETRVMRCGTSSPRRCGPCSTTYRGRIGLKAGSGLRPSRAGEVVGRNGLFLTVTAPGTSAHYMPDGRLCRCTPEGGVDLAAWNASAGVNFNRLMTYLRRQLGANRSFRVVLSTGEVLGFRKKDPGGASVKNGGLKREKDWRALHFRAAEVQKRRGALHFHVLLVADDGRPLSLSKGQLRNLAMRWGFGHEVDVQPVQPGHAAYVAKYVSKSAGDRLTVPWWKVDPDKPFGASTAATYRTWSSSPEFGQPIALIRRLQQHYLLVLEALPSWETRPAPARWALLPVPARPDTS